jgi:hypothetical protein
MKYNKYTPQYDKYSSNNYNKSLKSFNQLLSSSPKLPLKIYELAMTRVSFFFVKEDSWRMILVVAPAPAVAAADDDVSPFQAMSLNIKETCTQFLIE